MLLYNGFPLVRDSRILPGETRPMTPVSGVSSAGEGLLLLVRGEGPPKGDGRCEGCRFSLACLGNNLELHNNYCFHAGQNYNIVISTP